ncbi:sulfite exporter TauE/SafE family protein [Fructilactobacillus sanfranciscensis]|nr:sulfite exporter TauE/SafE family protein [Fructilactobacillus sanfranciscensis]
MSAITAVGSIFGSIILLFTSAETFKKVVPIIILFSGILVVLPKKHTSATEVKRGVQVMAVASLMAVGVYEGYFGAGTGVLLNAVLSRITTAPYVEYNATRNMAALCADILSVIIFVFTLPIDWMVVPIIAVCLFAGGYLGLIVVRFIPSKVMQYTISCFAIIVALYLGYQAFM